MWTLGCFVLAAAAIGFLAGATIVLTATLSWRHAVMGGAMAASGAAFAVGFIFAEILSY